MKGAPPPKVARIEEKLDDKQIEPELEETAEIEHFANHLKASASHLRYMFFYWYSHKCLSMELAGPSAH